MDGNEDEVSCCPGCSHILVIPYIRCAKCPHRTELCVQCFARGLEFKDHQNCHPYFVIKHDFPLYENHWTAGDELRLLKLIESFGYGNWKEIGVQMKNKTGSECEHHYNKCYINNPQPPLPIFPDYEQHLFPAPLAFKLSEDPPRPPEGSPLCVEMAGYSAARSEFSVEYDNFAEMDICNLNFDSESSEEEEIEEEDHLLLDELKFALIQIYNRRLRERHRRKRIVKEYGLINLRKWYVLCRQQNDRGLRQQIEDLRVFTTLISPIENDKLLEIMHYEQEIKNEIRQLQEFRANGLKRIRTGHIFTVLRSRRMAVRQKRHLLSDVMNHIRDETACNSWLQKYAVPEGSSRIINIPLPSAPRRAAPPLEIEGLPGYDRLTPSEKELCQSIRLVPQAYIQFRTLLINECRKHDGLKLAQARALIKIDVNKTRKVYDFLMQTGQISKLS